MSGRRRVALLALGFALLVGAWVMSTAPFAAPDEQSHYVRALGLADGTILGKKVGYPDPGLTQTQQAFISRDTRAFRVPAALSPYDVGCTDGKPDSAGSCLEASPNGNFPPLGYALPALALRFSRVSVVSSALWVARVGSAVQSLAFLVLGIVLLWDGTGWSLLGLLVATSPMVLYVASVLNPSGIQITASLAFAAGLLRIGRAPANVPRWVWVSIGVAGAVTILCGPIGLAFGIADLACFGALLGRRGLGELRRSGPRPLRACAAVLVAAGLLALLYTRFAGFSGHFGISPIRESLRLGFDQLGGVLRVAVGNFGAQTVPLPRVACYLWWLLVLAQVVAALWLGDLRERLVVSAVTVLALAFPVLYWAWVDRFSGFPVLGREVMPPLLLIPLVAGEVINRRRASVGFRASWRYLPTAAIAAVVAFQAYAWGFNAHAAPHDVTLEPNAIFTPPLGWAPWIGLAALGILAMSTFTVSDARASRVPAG
ncbi:MAG: DUF2142 domain-containing protein [Solirubrobacteraceae bacterium]